jgi:hypothetical protein
MAEVFIPEKRSTLSKFAGMFEQGSSLIQAGAKGKQAWGSLTAGKGTPTDGGGTEGGGGGGGSVGVAGAAAYKYAMGGEKAVPATNASTTASSGSSAMGYVAPAAALGTAAYDEYKYQSGVREGTRNSEGAGRYAIGQGQKPGSFQDKMQTKVASGFSDPVGATKTNLKNMGLGLTDSDSMSAIDRRQASQQNAMRDITEAQKALKVAGLPPEESRQISMKLEKARQNLGGKKSGRGIYTAKA